MTPEQMAKAMKAGCPPEVAARSRFPRAMDRAWALLWDGKTFIVPGAPAGIISIAHTCAIPDDPLDKELLPFGGCVAFSGRTIEMRQAFRSWWEGECQKCGLLFCGRFQFA